MALKVGGTITLTVTEETCQLTIVSTAGEIPRWNALRERRGRDPEGEVVATEPGSAVTRLLSNVADETIEVPGTATTLTVQQLDATITALIDRWRGEDISAGGFA